MCDFSGRDSIVHQKCLEKTDAVIAHSQDGKEGCYDITPAVRDAIKKSGLDDGVCIVYRRRQLAELSKYLGKRFGKGFSETNLKNARKFYQIYAPQFVSLCLPNLEAQNFCRLDGNLPIFSRSVGRIMSF